MQNWSIYSSLNSKCLCCHLWFLFVLFSADILKSPEPPLLCTPGFKIKKKNNPCPLKLDGNSDPGSPDPPANLATTPEVPAFQTPYVNRLVSSKKVSKVPFVCVCCCFFCLCSELFKFSTVRFFLLCLLAFADRPTAWGSRHGNRRGKPHL